MSISDTCVDAADDLARYLYDPDNGPADRQDQRRIACMAILSAFHFLGWSFGEEEKIDAAIEGDTSILEQHIQWLQKHGQDLRPLEDERREWYALVALLKAIDEHIVPLMPDLDWLIAAKRERAHEWHEEFQRKYGGHSR